MLRRNEGPVDRAIRLVAGALLIAGGLFLLDGLQGSVVGIVVATLGGWFVLTGAIGVCPLYIPFGITTVPAPEASVPGPSQPEVPVLRRSRVTH